MYRRFFILTLILASLQSHLMAQEALIAFKTNHGTFLSALPKNQGYKVVSDREILHGWETFKARRVGEDGNGNTLYSLQTNHGTYVKAVPTDQMQNPGRVVADAKQVNGWEKLRINKVEGNLWTIQTTFNGGRFLSALTSESHAKEAGYKFQEGEEPSLVVATRPKAEGWEKYELIVIDDPNHLFPPSGETLEQIDRGFVGKSAEEIIEHYLNSRLAIGNEGKVEIENLEFVRGKVHFTVKVRPKQVVYIRGPDGIKRKIAEAKATLRATGEYDPNNKDSIGDCKICVDNPHPLQKYLGKRSCTTLKEIAKYLVGKTE